MAETRSLIHTLTREARADCVPFGERLNLQSKSIWAPMGSQLALQLFEHIN